MRSNRQPLVRLVWVALLAMSAAGSQALRSQRDDGGASATPALATGETWAPRDVSRRLPPGTFWEDEFAPVAAAEPALVEPLLSPSEPPTASATAEPQFVDADDPHPAAPAHPAKPAGPKSIRRICRVTAYSDRGVTAAGVSSGVGQCAAPEHIPIGSKVYIPALGRSYVVTDRTHRRFRQSTIDLFVPCDDRCRQFGRRYLEVEITPPESKPSHQNLIRTAQRLSRTG